MITGVIAGYKAALKHSTHSYGVTGFCGSQQAQDFVLTLHKHEKLHQIKLRFDESDRTFSVVTQGSIDFLGNEGQAES